MAEKPTNPRWKCPECSSVNVQVSFPTWYYESTDYELTFVETDAEASILCWFCEACDESGIGKPDEVQS